MERHGNKWRVVVAVPRNLWNVIGKRKLKRSLETDSLTVANRLKHDVIAELRADIDRARYPQGTPESIRADALRLKARLRQAKDAGDDDLEDTLRDELMDRAEQIAGAPVGTDAQGEPTYAHSRERLARDFAGVASGRQTPIEAHRATYLAQLQVKPRTRADDERALRHLLDWCAREHVPAFLETFGKREAVRFQDALLHIMEGRSPVTLNKYIRRLGCYWKWLDGRSEVDGNIWHGRTYVAPHRTSENKPREFTREEMVALLSGPAPQHMHDLMRIAALTGARLDAIVCLRVRDCTDGVLTFKPQKREPGSRRVPIHSALRPIIKRRVKGKQPDDDVFPEWPPVKRAGSKRERSFKTSTHFTEYRRSVGVADVQEGQRLSRVNFHSFRRWFITAAEQADQPPHVIEAVVGHKRQGMSLGVYSGGPLDDQMRQCVEAVRLPRHVRPKAA